MIFGALGQETPAANVLTDIYAVPTGKRATFIVVACNRGVNAFARVALAPAGAADALPQYLMYDLPIASGDTQSTVRITAGAGDVIRVRGSTGDFTFNVNGIEEDA